MEQFWAAKAAGPRMWSLFSNASGKKILKNDKSNTRPKVVKYNLERVDSFILLSSYWR